MPMDSDKKQFIDYLQFQKKYSPLTILAYTKNIDEFLAYLKQEGMQSFNDVHYQQIRGYLAMLHRKNLARSSINHRISTLRSLFHFLTSQEVIDQDGADDSTPSACWGCTCCTTGWGCSQTGTRRAQICCWTPQNRE